MKRLIPLVSLLLLAGSALSASTVLNVSFEHLARSANRVVSGEIVSINPLAGENGIIYSNVTMRVTRAVPRALEGQTVTVRMVGGELDGRKVYVQGMPRFTVGEEVVLFLNRSTESVMGATVGLWQGVFYVGRDKTTGESFILDHQRRPVLGLNERNEVLKGPQTSESLSLKALSLDGDRRPWKAEQFFERVRGFRGSATK